MRFPQPPSPFAALPRWQRRLLEAVLILADILGAQYGQTRVLPDGVAPPLVGLLTDGSPARAGAGRSGGFAEHCSAPAQPAGFAKPAVESTAMLLACLSAGGRNARLWWAEAFPA